MNNTRWPTLGQTPIFMSRTKRISKVRGQGPKLLLPWKTTDQQDCFWYLFGIAVRFNWINFDVWLKQAFSGYLSRPKLSLGSAHVKYGVWPRPWAFLLSWLWHLLYNFDTFLILFARNSWRITSKQWFTLSCWLKHFSMSIILLTPYP